MPDSNRKPLAPRLLILAAFALLAGCSAPIDSSEQHSTEQWLPSAVTEGNLRFGTFNIRNYPELPYVPTIDPETGAESSPPNPPLSHLKHTNDEALVSLLVKLDFDFLAIQEIVDPELFVHVVTRLSELRDRDYAAVFSENATSSPQQIGFIYDRDELKLLWTREHPEIDTSGRLRPGFSARFRGLEEGDIDFGTMVLHLASGSSHKRAALRAEQLAMAADIVRDEIEESGDEDYILLGDLNTARDQEELAIHDPTLAQGAGLSRQANEMSCTTYWAKKSTSPLLRPSSLDHVYLSGFGEWASDVPMLSGAHCAEHRCERYESTDKLSGSSFYDVSDHCPVYFEVQTLSDDAP